MGKVIVCKSLFDDNIDTKDHETLKQRLEYLENEMIMPPDNIKSIIDKTANFVKKNGRIFEQKVYKEKKKQFGFIESSHPYFFYYQYKLHELYLGVGEKKIIPKAILEIKKREDLNKSTNNEHILKICDFVKEDTKQTKNSVIYSIVDEEREEKNEDSEKGEEEKNKKPIEITEDIYSIISPFINSVDVDLIKTTALFVARNGNKFLNELIHREKNNNQYDFLRANNLYFNYFSKLIDIYTKCILPNDTILNKIKTYSNNKTDILNYSYSLFVSNMKKKEEEQRKMEEKLKNNAFYDWSSFTIVETINFDEDIYYLPQSIDFNNVENYVLNQLFDTDNTYTNLEKINNITYHTNHMDTTNKIYEQNKLEENITTNQPYEHVQTDENAINYQKNKYDQNNLEEYEQDDYNTLQKYNNMGDSYMGELDKNASIDKKRNDTNKIDERSDERSDDDNDEEEMIVVKNYEKNKKHRLNNENVHLCPITHQPIDINDMTKHLKTLLLDPKWKEQKDKLYERAKKEASFTPLEDIEGNLSVFVVNRPDIFGSIDEEINEHTSLENKKKTNNKKEQNDVKNYIKNIFNKIMPGPAMDHYPQNNDQEQNDSNQHKKQKTS
ncbi:splicing factor 3A subunit 1, putative [Hepatocystis sp. ex Piliocolobus tephrosceles]|nr:splicing factor 3A subunit 1, putative [Hepatocystis sp. ex Piliocolobus tephrosceles]